MFNAANQAGAFSQLLLPSLTGNLAWNTNSVNSAGTLSVVALTSPAIAGIHMVGGSLVISGSGGTPNWPYILLTATNLSTAQWTPVVTNQFDAAGNFILTNAINASLPQTFYRLQLPP